MLHLFFKFITHLCFLLHKLLITNLCPIIIAMLVVSPIELYELFIHHHCAWGRWGWRAEHLEIKCFCKDRDQATSASISLVRTIHMSTFSFRGVETYCPFVQHQRTVLVNVSNIFNRYDLIANKNLLNYFPSLLLFFFPFLSIASTMFVFGVSSPSSMSAHVERP